MQKSKFFFLNLAVGCLLVISLLIGGQVVLRNFFISSIPDYIQIAEIFVALTILFPLINLHTEHLRISFFFNQFSQKTKFFLDLFSIIIVFLLPLQHGNYNEFKFSLVKISNVAYWQQKKLTKKTVMIENRSKKNFVF